MIIDNLDDYTLSRLSNPKLGPKFYRIRLEFPYREQRLGLGRSIYGKLGLTLQRSRHLEDVLPGKGKKGNL